MKIQPSYGRGNLDEPPYVDLMQGVVGAGEKPPAILQAIAKGDLLPTEGTVLSNIVEKRRVAMETLEFEERITALEKKK